MSKPNDPPPVIDWAIEHARASLRVGVSVPEIERRLVARGLDPMIAEAAVTNALSDHVRGKMEPSESELSQNTQRIAAIVVGCGCVFLAFCSSGVMSATVVLISVVAILVRVWFAQIVGERPNNLVRWLGWLVLLLLFVYRLIILLYSH